MSIYVTWVKLRRSLSAICLIRVRSVTSAEPRAFGRRVSGNLWNHDAKQICTCEGKGGREKRVESLPELLNASADSFCVRGYLIRDFWQSVVVLGQEEMRVNTRIHEARLTRGAGRGGGEGHAVDIKGLREEKVFGRGKAVSRRFASACEVAIRTSWEPADARRPTRFLRVTMNAVVLRYTSKLYCEICLKNM